MARAGRYRYGSWRGGDDPLAAPFDVRAAVDDIGRDVLGGASLRDALRSLLDRGHDGRQGLDALRQQVRRRRLELQRRGDLAGTLDHVRQLLDQALAAEREELAGRSDDAARLAEMQLESVLESGLADTATAVSELRDYDWASAEGRENYERIRRLLQHEVLDAQFAGMRQALQSAGQPGQAGGDPEAMQRVRDMVADLNRLLAEHARGADTSEQFEGFMDRHGESFPEQPRDTDDLIDLLARRQAAAERLMRSLSPDQRDELQGLMAEALDDPDLESQLGQLRDNLAALRPGLGRGQRVQMSGEESLGYGDAVGAVADLADLESLERQLGQQHPGATLDDVDVDALARQLAPSVAADLGALRDLERELERQGYLSAGERPTDGLQLTPKALRRLGETALRRVFAQLDASGRGDHDDRRSGAAEEPTGATLPWAYGEDRPLDAAQTVRNAVLRTAASAASAASADERSCIAGVRAPEMHDPSLRTGRPGAPVGLAVEDLAVAEAERRTQAAVALCVDLSFSMVTEDRWGPMKQTALALAHLVETRFRGDALQIIGFDRWARRLTPVELAGVEPEYVQGTNLHHALSLAGRHLRRHPEAEPVVLVVTDGEPTAHLEPDGTAYFNWPTTTATLRATVAEVDTISRAGASLNWFMLGEDPGLARFVDAIARRSGGRVFTPELGRLGEYVVADYLRARSGRRAAS
ncbi:VWA domain-containing protein [soil metagenome]